MTRRIDDVVAGGGALLVHGPSYPVTEVRAALARYHREVAFLDWRGTPSAGGLNAARAELEAFLSAAPAGLVLVGSRVAGDREVALREALPSLRARGVRCLVALSPDDALRSDFARAFPVSVSARVIDAPGVIA